MVTRIDKLTPAQEARFGEWAEKWIGIGLQTGDADFETFDKAIRVAYAKANIPFPEKIIRVQSPLVGALAASISRELLKRNNGAVDVAVDVAVGGAVGDAVRGAVRDAVDVAVDVAVGGAVGVAVGGAVDVAVRDAVDVAVDVAVRDAVRGAVDGAVRGAVGGAVDDAVRGAVRDAVDVAVDVAVRDAVRGAVDGAVRGAVGGAVDGAVRGAVRDAVDVAVDVAVGGAVAVDVAVGGAVRDAVGGAEWHDWEGGQFWVGGWYWGSPSFVSFFTDVCDLELSPDIMERAKSYRDLCTSVNYFWPNSHFVMVCDRPAFIARDDQGRLHNDQRKAIEYKDGWGLYVLDGVVLDEGIWKRIVSQEMAFDEIVAIQNADERAVALKYNKNAIIASGAELIDEHPTAGELFLIERQPINAILDERQLYFLRMKCPTGRTFVEAVEPNFARANPYAINCQAQAFGVPVEIYSQLRREG